MPGRVLLSLLFGTTYLCLMSRRLTNYELKTHVQLRVHNFYIVIWLYRSLLYILAPTRYIARVLPVS